MQTFFFHIAGSVGLQVSWGYCGGGGVVRTVALIIKVKLTSINLVGGEQGIVCFIAVLHSRF